jgi:acylglycerol lipase
VEEEKARFEYVLSIPLSRALSPTMASLEEHWVSGPNTVSFFTGIYNPPATPIAAILFLHGFADYFGRYGEALQLIANNGIAVVGFDQRGWGKTYFDRKKGTKVAYGQTTAVLQMEDIDFMIGWTKDKFSSIPVFLMGHSMVRIIVLQRQTHLNMRIC